MKIKKISTTITLITLISLITPSPAFAIYDPLSTPNNRIGIHILDPSEIQQAANLVNSSGGDWGYVTVPVRGDDRDKKKWSTFFKQARELHLIPILRLATFGRGDQWVLPTEDEVLDFANFLDALNWPTQNRYIIIFNEINHSLEWGGFIDPSAYANVLNFTIDIFKNKNQDFFILPAALDMATETNHVSYEALAYWEEVFAAQPDLINKLDGWNSHAYPNPAFSGRPTDTHKRSLISYRYELKLLESLGRDNIPVFITETGWDQEKLSTEKLNQYWTTAFNQIWDDDQIITITPFLLQAYDGPFTKFSLLNMQHQSTSSYQTIQNLPKTAGQPLLTETNNSLLEMIPVVKAASNIPRNNSFSLTNLMDQILNFINKLFQVQHQAYMKIGDAKIIIEIADEPDEISLGLGNRVSIPADHGMLFEFGQLHTPSFWMKNTLFPLDIIWISDFKVVDITQNIPVEPDPTNPQNHYRPSEPIDLVLEVNAGFTADHDINIGDQVSVFK